MELICIGCNRRPEEIREYIAYAKAQGMTPSEFVLQEEGTLNVKNGHFACTRCYVEMGMPTARVGRWVAP